MKQIDLSNIDWVKISTDLACFEAENRMEQAETIANMVPQKTALFYGTETRPTCTYREKLEYRKHTRAVLQKLLRTGITTILLEDSTIFGFYALDELVRLRRKYEFTLIVTHRDTYKYSWVHTANKKVSRFRTRKSIYYYGRSDELLGSITRAAWIDICSHHIAVAITEKPPYYCSPKAMTPKQYRAWGPPDENNAQKLKQRLLCDDGRMLLAKK